MNVSYIVWKIIQFCVDWQFIYSHFKSVNHRKTYHRKQANLQQTRCTSDPNYIIHPSRRRNRAGNTPYAGQHFRATWKLHKDNCRISNASLRCVLLLKSDQCHAMSSIIKLDSRWVMITGQLDASPALGQIHLAWHLKQKAPAKTESRLH